MNNYWRWWLVIIGVSGVIVYALSAVLLPFVAGMVLAYFLSPVAGWLERKGLSRSLATVLIMLFFFLVVGIAIALVLPLIESQIMGFVAHMPDYKHSLQLRIAPFVDQLMNYVSPMDLQKMQSALGDNAGMVAGWVVELVDKVLKGGLALMDILSLLFIMPIVTFYLLRDWDGLVSRVDQMLPRNQANSQP